VDPKGSLGKGKKEALDSRKRASITGLIKPATVRRIQLFRLSILTLLTCFSQFETFAFWET
jgi:hypothetical protein